MISSIKIAIVLTLVSLGGLGFFYVKKLQSDLETARANVAKMEQAVAISEASIENLQKETIRLGELNLSLQSDLQKAEQYGDELRATLQRHNLTHLATRKPGPIEKRMQNATDQLWDDLESITSPSGVRDIQPGTGDSNSNQD
jgi:hypothetical protein